MYRNVSREIYVVGTGAGLEEVGAGRAGGGTHGRRRPEINSLIERRVRSVTLDGMPEFTTDITHSSWVLAAGRWTVGRCRAKRAASYRTYYLVHRSTSTLEGMSLIVV